MAFRGRGRGRGGFGGGGFRPVPAVPFVLFPEIDGLGKAEYSTANIQLVKWSWALQKDRHLSPYYYEDRKQFSEKREKPDIERYKDKELQAKKVKPPLSDVIELSTDHMPAELAKGQTRRVKKLKWTAGQELNNVFDKFQNKDQGEGTEKKENEDEEEEEEGQNEEDDGEFSDEGDYEQAEYCDDDEDDYNMADDNDNEPSY